MSEKRFKHADINADHAELLKEMKTLRRALDPFARLARLNRDMNVPDDEPVREFAPGIWPTMKDCRRANEAMLSSGKEEEV